MTDSLDTVYTLLVCLSNTSKSYPLIYDACVNGHISTIKTWKLLNPGVAFNMPPHIFTKIIENNHLPILTELIPIMVCFNPKLIIEKSFTHPNAIDIIFTNPVIKTLENVKYAVELALESKQTNILTKILPHLEAPLLNQQIYEIKNLDDITCDLLKVLVEHIVKYR